MASLYKKPVVITDPQHGSQGQIEVQEMVGPVPRRTRPREASSAGHGQGRPPDAAE